MKKIISICAYFAALLLVFVSIATFAGNRKFADMLIRITGITVSPRYTGGPVERVIDRGAYTLKIHKPVFAGLFSEPDSGFVQVTYTGTLPSEVNDDIDFDSDGIYDFTLAFIPGSSEKSFVPKNIRVTGLDGIHKITEGYAARILLDNKPTATERLYR